MPLQKLKLFNFRNFEKFECDFNEEINLILGKNAQGKTSLVEAIYFLSALKSFRTSKNNNLVKFDFTQASAHADILQEQQSLRLGIIFGGSAKELLVNDYRKNLSEYYGRFQAVSFTPDDLEIIKGSPEVRRSLVDKLIADLEPAKLNFLRKYAQALRNKNILLKNNASKKELISWNQVLVPLAREIIINRRQLIKKLGLVANDKMILISDEAENVNLLINSDLLNEEKEALEEAEIYEKYNLLIEKEQNYKRCLIGPQLDDIKILINNIDARIVASQGQSRSLALALKLAIFDLIADKRLQKPVLILDDFDAEFDCERLERMCQIITKLNTQVFITSTNLDLTDLFQNSNLGIFNLENGNLKTIS